MNHGNKDKKKNPFLVDPAEGTTIKKVIGVISGKGGVGKSLVTSLLACHTARLAKQTAILDADVTGPSIPHSFGMHEKAASQDKLILPVESNALKIKMISTNLLLENETDPVLWRGPIVAQAIKQFWSEVKWGDIDTMYVDMPPGTGDVALTVLQSLPLDGLVIVTTPQDMVSMIVQKAMKMAEAMRVPVLGLIENMSYFVCPNCDAKHEIYGKSKADEICQAYNIPVLAKLAMDPEITQAVDRGVIESITINAIEKAVLQIHQE